MSEQGAVGASDKPAIQPENSVPFVAVLGVAAPFLRVGHFHRLISAYNIHELRTEVVAPFYPLPVKGLTIVIAVYAPAVRDGWTLVFTNPATSAYFTIGVQIRSFNASLEPPIPGSRDVAPQWEHAPWLLMGIPFPEQFALIERPGRLRIDLREGDRDLWTGGINFLAYNPEPLTPERIAAIRSEPNASKAAHFRLACKECDDALTTFVAIDRPSVPSPKDAVWYLDLPDEFRCRCGKTVVNLQYLRRGFHAVLGERFATEGDELTSARLYEPSSLEVIYDAFAHVLQASKGEADLQTFLQENPILLHQLTPRKIIAKAPIRGKYQTDFVVATASGDLILIELEAAGRSLLKKDGHPTASLTHAISQVNDWLHEFREHRLTCLADMNLRDEEIAKIRGVVVMGREAGHEREHLRRLKASNFGDVTLLTYDDLLSGLAELIRSVKRHYRS